MKKIYTLLLSLTVSLGALYAQPTTGATAPTQDAAKVISMFSDSYTDVSVDTWKTDWSPGVSLEDVSINGNAVKKYTNIQYVGIETTSSTIDATNMTHFHVDIWSDNFTEFKIKLVDFGADASWSGGDDVEHELVFATPNQSQWVSYDIALTEFTNLTTKAHMAQYIFSAAPSGANTVYLDNMYFYTKTSTSVNSANFENIKLFASKGVLTVKTNDLINGKIEVYSVTGQEIVSKTISTEKEQLAIPTNGLYIVRISDSNKQIIETRKVFAN